MRKSNRAWGIAAAAGLATGMFAAVIAMLTVPERDTADERRYLSALLVLATVCLVAFIGQVWSRFEDALEQWTARPTAAWPRHEPSLRFSDQEPDALTWGPGMGSPRVTIARLEGQLLHRRLVLAARELITRDGEYAPFDGLDLADGGEPFQAVVRFLGGKQENAPSRWLIIVRDPEKVNEEFSATTPGTPFVSQPSVLAAVVTYKKGTANWRITVEELHALDAAYVAGRAISAWTHVAYQRGLATAAATATAKLDRDGITWEVNLHVLTAQSDATDADERLGELLRELRVPIEVAALGALP